MNAAVLIGGLVLAAVLATAGVAKLLDLEGSRRALASFGVPPRLARPLGTLLPAAELATAALLAAGALSSAAARIGGLAAVALLAVFSAGIAASLARGQAPDCHCFGQLHSAPAGPRALARNGGLAALAAWVAAGGDPLPPALAGVAALSLFAVATLTTRGRVPKRAEQPSPDGGLGAGAPAPGFRLRDLAGAFHTLDSLRAGDRPVLLLFTDPGCGPCVELAPQVARWQDAYADELTIAVIERERDGETGPDAHGRTNVLLQRDGEVADLYGAQGTPTAVLVDAGGTIASPVAAGRQQIETLMARTVAGLERESRSVPPVRPGLGLRIRRRELVVRGVSAGAAVGALGPSAAAARRLLRPRSCEENSDCPGARICLHGHCAEPQCDARQECRRGRVCVQGKCENCYRDEGLCHRTERCEKVRGGYTCKCTNSHYPDRCGEQCTDFKFDHENCGGCGKRFACNADETCLPGGCVGGDGSVCPGGCDDQAICCKAPTPDDPTRIRCVYPRESTTHCGGCNQPCAGGQGCCEGRCRDLQSDSKNCGQCRKTCKDDEFCFEGRCRTRCPGGLKRCGDRCVDAGSDPNNCGDCGTKCSGPFDTGECCNGTCCDINADTCCSGGCTNTSLNEENCGACGNVCRPGEFCRFGVCTCPPGQTCG